MNIKYDKLKEVIEKMTLEHHTLSTMESCTGGGVSSAITNIPGASEVLHFSAVTYSNEYKIKMGVDPRIINKFGVYSLETSKAMAKAICLLTGSDIGIGISGNLNLTDQVENKGGIVYFSVYQFVEKKFYSKVLTINNHQREESKKAIINVIIDTLYNIYF
jgi:nicotinamide-nucleotide amidase